MRYFKCFVIYGNFIIKMGSNENIVSSGSLGNILCRFRNYVVVLLILLSLNLSCFWKSKLAFKVIFWAFDFLTAWDYYKTLMKDDLLVFPGKNNFLSFFTGLRTFPLEKPISLFSSDHYLNSLLTWTTGKREMSPTKILN